MAYHAKLSPSSSSRWTECTASIKMQEGLPDSSSEASRQGTACHQLCAEVLEHGYSLESYLGREMWFTGRQEYWADEWPLDSKPEHVVKIDQTMLDACETGVDFVLQQVELTGGQLEVEQRVPIGHFTGEGQYWALPDDLSVPVPEGTPGAEWVESAGGTSDVVLLTPDTIYTADFKFGRQEVEAFDTLVPARGDKPPVRRMNLQLACYILGALEKFGWLHDFKFASATIIQPHLNHISEFTCTIEELLEVQAFLQAKAEETRTNPQFKPSEDSCHFCKAKGPGCAAQTQMVLETALEGFDDLATAKPAAVQTSRLGTLYALIPMVQEWCKAVGERVWDELNTGRPVVREDGLKYMLVQGRKGDRVWGDPAEAEKMLKHYRLRDDEMYVRKVIGPATAEKLAKVKKKELKPPVLNKNQWAKLQELITQSEGNKSIALETESRPALPMAADGFTDVAEDCSDLLGL